MRGCFYKTERFDVGLRGKSGVLECFREEVRFTTERGG